MSARDNLLQFAKELADPDWSLSVPKPAKDTITSLLQVIEDSKPRTISTIEEVDALPRKAVVMTAFGDALTIYRSPRIPIEHYHFLVTDGLTATVLHEGPEKVTD